MKRESKRKTVICLFRSTTNVQSHKTNMSQAKKKSVTFQETIYLLKSISMLINGQVYAGIPFFVYIPKQQRNKQEDNKYPQKCQPIV